MKCLIIYKSVHHQNTKKVAEAMATTLKADLATPDDLDGALLDQYDLIGMGSGIYFGKHHRVLLDFVKGVQTVRKKEVFLFYTSGFNKFPGLPSFETALSDQLKDRGANIIGTFSCLGWETCGPFRIGGGKNKGQPNEDDLRRAQEFASTLLSN